PGAGPGGARPRGDLSQRGARALRQPRLLCRAGTASRAGAARPRLPGTATGDRPLAPAPDPPAALTRRALAVACPPPPPPPLPPPPRPHRVLPDPSYLSGPPPEPEAARRADGLGVPPRPARGRLRERRAAADASVPPRPGDRDRPGRPGGAVRQLHR